MTMPHIRVCIFEDHAPLREALTLLIGGTPGFEVMGAFPDTQDLLAEIQRLEPDVVLMDISMPGENGIEAVQRLRQHFTELSVLMLTVFEDEERIFQALCAGANGYLLKSTPPGNLLQAITEVQAGGAPMTPAIARKALKLLQDFGRQPDSSAYHLTPRESEVLAQLAKGHSTKIIAAKLDISYETVRSHLKVIYDKLHVASMTEAVAKALKERLI